MLDALARFVYRRRRLVAIGAAIFFVIAGAVGGSVASHLDPYGADDPATDSVKADDLLQAHGYRDASVIVLFQDAASNQKCGASSSTQWTGSSTRSYASCRYGAMSSIRLLE